MLMWPVALIQLGVGLLAIGYGVQAIIFPRQNAIAFRPWREYHPAVMLFMGVWAALIGLAFVVGAIVKLIR